MLKYLSIALTESPRPAEKIKIGTFARYNLSNKSLAPSLVASLYRWAIDSISFGVNENPLKSLYMKYLVPMPRRILKKHILK